MVVQFVDVSGIVINYHCLNCLFIRKVHTQEGDGKVVPFRY